MNRRVKQYFAGILIAAFMAVILPIQTLTAYAANGRIAFSDKKASVGSEIDINMKITLSGGGALSNATVTLNYDASMLEFLSGTGASGGAGTIRVTVGGDTTDAKELVTALKFKALQAGSTKITVADGTEEVYDSENKIVTIDQMGNSAITLEALANASTEASLSDLKVSPGTLSPAFSADVMSYTASVDADVTKITVSAPAADSKASVVISGNEDLQPGENQVVCKVIAEDGRTVKEYTIAVMRAGTGQDGTAPAGSIAVETPAKTVTIIPLDEGVAIPEGFTECTIKIGGQDAQGWVWATDTEHKYCVFYGVNEAGEKDFYRYDLTEKTMQRYFQDPASENYVTRAEFTKVAEDYNSLLEDYELRLYIIFGLGGVAAILMILVMVLLVKKGRGGDDDYTNYDEKLNDRKKPVRSFTGEQRYQQDMESKGSPLRVRPGELNDMDTDDEGVERRLLSEEEEKDIPEVRTSRGRASTMRRAAEPERESHSAYPTYPTYPSENPAKQRVQARTMSVRPTAGPQRAMELPEDDVDDDFEFMDLDD